jgi:hypothetical protein
MLATNLVNAILSDNILTKNLRREIKKAGLKPVSKLRPEINAKVFFVFRAHDIPLIQKLFLFRQILNGLEPMTVVNVFAVTYTIRPRN